MFLINSWKLSNLYYNEPARSQQNTTIFLSFLSLCRALLYSYSKNKIVRFSFSQIRCWLQLALWISGQHQWLPYTRFGCLQPNCSKVHIWWEGHRLYKLIWYGIGGIKLDGFVYQRVRADLLQHNRYQWAKMLLQTFLASGA